MSYSALLHPRKEVLSNEGVDSIIDLANVEDKRKRRLEARPADFFALTYPTSDMRRVIQALAQRFEGKIGSPGLFLFEGLKGSGKSHLLLTVYHLFKSPVQAQAWLAKHGLTCAVPYDAVVVINKFTDMPLFSIWNFVFEKLTGINPPKGVIQPGLEDVQKALGERRMVLILDELEQGIRAIGDPAIQSQNIAFLQMLSEWSMRSDQVTLFASIYADTQEPGSTLKRVPALRVQFAQSNERDRANVVLHRLFENHLDFDAKLSIPVVDGYVNYWARYHKFDADDYRTRFLLSFPFTPDILDVLLKRVPARGGFQSVRGALGFLGNLVRITYQSADIITPGQASLNDRETTVRLSDLDTTGDLVNRAHDNLIDLAKMPLASELAAATLLYTLSGSGRATGATREELIRSTVRPGIDINEFEHALAAFQKYAANFHESADLYYFDMEENADAKVEFHSLNPDYDARAPSELRRLWLTDVFKESSAVIYSSDETATREAIEGLEKGRLRWVLAPRPLTAVERHSLYFGPAARNEIVLLEPKDKSFDLDRNADIGKWMRRQLAAQDLASPSRTRDTKKKDDYLRIAGVEKNYVIQAIRRAGLSYIKWDAYGSTPQADAIEEEPLGTAATKEDVLTNLGQNLYPVTLFVEHLSGRLNSLWKRTVKEVEQEYHNTLGFPVPTHKDRISKALQQLCRDSKLSLNHQRGNYCGETPPLSDAELSQAIIDAPFSEPNQPEPKVVVRPDVKSPDGSSTTVVRPATPGSPSDVLPIQPGEAVQDVPMLPQSSPGALRQAIAQRLQAMPTASVHEIRFTIVLEQSTGDLSTLPAAFRGSLAGEGDLFAEINISQRGSFSKAQVEQMVERLPQISGAAYHANMKLVGGAKSD